MNVSRTILLSVRRGLLPGLLLLVCVAAGFSGSWLFSVSGLQPDDQTPIEQQRSVVLQEGEVVAQVARDVSPSVVSIITSGATGSLRGQATQSAGTGIIISKDGYILTNKHVIPESTSQVTVVTSDDHQYDAVTVVGRDSINDLAFLKINDVSDLAPAHLADSSQVTVGQKVVAIGNALGQYQTTVTSGIISGTGRPVTATDGAGQDEQLTDLFQTDAAINPGNSGGPLVNINSEVIGINTAVAQDAQGIGFAIPINDAKGLITGVLKTGKLQRGYIGIRYVTITPDVVKEYKLSVSDGALVRGDGAVLSGSPAERAGIKAGDIITKVNGVTLTKNRSLTSIISQFGPGETVTLTLLHDGKSREIKVTLEVYNG